jgi:hypothetical protein
MQELASPPDRVPRAFPRFGFELAIEVQADQSPERSYGSQKRQCFRGISAVLGHQPSQVLFRFRICGLGNEERNFICMSLDNSANPLTEDRSNQNVGIDDKGTTFHANLLGLPLLLAASSTDLLVLPHQLVLGCAPLRDHRVELLGGGAHRFYFSLAAAFLRGNKKAQRFAMTSDSERTPAFQVARQVFAELTHADLFGFHIVYPVYTISSLNP